MAVSINCTFSETPVRACTVSETSVLTWLSNVSMVIQLWKLIKHLNNPDDEDSTFFETLVRASATRYKVHEDIFNWHNCESSPEDSGLPTLIRLANFINHEECRLLGCYAGTWALTAATWRNIPEDGISHSHRSANLKSFINNIAFCYVFSRHAVA
jgi:hypothetical protein